MYLDCLKVLHLMTSNFEKNLKKNNGLFPQEFIENELKLPAIHLTVIMEFLESKKMVKNFWIETKSEKIKLQGAALTPNGRHYIMYVFGKPFLKYFALPVIVSVFTTICTLWANGII